MGQRDDVSCETEMVVLQKSRKRKVEYLGFVYKVRQVHSLADQKQFQLINELTSWLSGLPEICEEKVGDVFVLGVILYPSKGEKFIKG